MLRTFNIVADKIDFDTKKILREEEKPKLFSIGVDFYIVAENYVCELENELKLYNTNNTKGKILYDQLRSTKENIKSIIIHRMRKIVRDAQTATFSDERNKQGPDNLTPEERELFDALYEKLTEWKDTHLDSIVSRELPPDKSGWLPPTIPKDDLLAQHIPEQERNVVGSALKGPVYQGQPVNTEKDVNMDIDIATIARGTIHLNPKGVEFSLPLDPRRYNPISVDCPVKVKEIPIKDYIILRVLKNIPTFVGIDSRQYTLSKEDVVSVPTVNGNALISRSAAVRIENR